MRSQLHPAVQAYARTDREMRDILLDYAASDSIARAALLLREYVEGRQAANVAFVAARRCDLKGTDAGLCALFLANWAEAALIYAGATRSDTCLLYT
ncbi:MAG: hypothetical protein N2255_09980, partial [Kiritimatiellae bacterium]|nr:hypothetical protein [Kiritimatiellia bacterium]